MPIIRKKTWTPWKLIPKDVQDCLISDYKALLTSPNEKEREWAKGFEVIFGKENLQTQPLTYEDVEKELICKTPSDKVAHMMPFGEFPYKGLGTPYFFSPKQAEKLLAINKLLNVAAYLNKNEDGTPWKLDWENMTPDDKVWSLGIDENEIRAYYVQKYDGARAEIVYFRTKQLVEQAVQILGEDTVRLALTTEY